MFQQDQETDTVEDKKQLTKDKEYKIRNSNTLMSKFWQTSCC